MRKILPIFALAIFSCEKSPEKVAGNALPESKYGSFEERLKKVILPEIDFKETTISDVLGSIQHLSQIHADDKMGISLLFDPAPEKGSSGTRISLQMEQASLKEVLEAVAKQIRMKVILREELGRAEFRSMSYDATLHKKIFNVSPVFSESVRLHWKQVAGDVGANSEDKAAMADSLISFFENHGISFGRTSSAVFDSERNEVTVVSERSELDLVEAFLNSFDRTYLALMDDPNIHAIAEIRKRLDETILPKVEFNNIPFREALHELQTHPASDLPSLIVDLGDDRSAAEAARGDVPVAHVPITLDLTNVSLGDAFRAVVDKVDGKLEIESFAIKVVPASRADRVYHVRIFPAPPSVFDIAMPVFPDPFAETVVVSEEPRTKDVKEVLMSAGIVFSGESNAIYDASTQQLVVRTTEDQLKLIERFVEPTRASK